MRGEIVDLVGTTCSMIAETGAVAQIAVVQLQSVGTRAETLAQVIDSPGRETGSATNHPAHFSLS